MAESWHRFIRLERSRVRIGRRLRALSIYPHFPEILVGNQMERSGPSGKFPGKGDHLLRWITLTGPSGRSEMCRSIYRSSRFQYRASVNFPTVSNVAEADCYECSVCKFAAPDLTVLLMHQCSTSSGT